jgi:hypothetical protein
MKSKRRKKRSTSAVSIYNIQEHICVPAYCIIYPPHKKEFQSSLFLTFPSLPSCVDCRIRSPLRITYHRIDCECTVDVISVCPVWPPSGSMKQSVAGVQILPGNFGGWTRNGGTILLLLLPPVLVSSSATGSNRFQTKKDQRRFASIHE